MTKSIHFAAVPNMRGKLTMRFTDVVAEDLRPKEMARIHAKEMSEWEYDIYSETEAAFDEYLASDEYRLLMEYGPGPIKI